MIFRAHDGGEWPPAAGHGSAPAFALG